MTDLHFWKLALDGALVASLVYMCVKFRGTTGPNVNVGHLRELESSLKQLLKEAERSSMTLGEELTRKKGQLEQLLFDIETAEQRMNRSIDEASELKRGLREASRRAQENAQVTSEQEPVREKAAAVSKPQSVNASQQAPQPSRLEPQYDYATAPEPPSFENLGTRAVERHRQVNKAVPHKEEPAPMSQKDIPVNIYGEPIQPDAPQMQSLRENIEREIIDEPVQYTPEQPVEHSLEDIYGAADDLLRAGQSLEHVARTTRLPIDEVRMLSEIISREQFIEQSQDNLSSPVRRDIQVL